MGRKKEALRLLKEIPYWFVTYGLILTDPLLDLLRDNPEFQEILIAQRNEMLELRKLAKMGNYTNDLEWILNK